MSMGHAMARLCVCLLGWVQAKRSSPSRVTCPCPPCPAPTQWQDRPGLDSSAWPQLCRDRQGLGQMGGVVCLQIHVPLLRASVELGEKMRVTGVPPRPRAATPWGRTPQDSMGQWESHSTSLHTLCPFPASGDEEHVKAPAVPPHPCPCSRPQWKASTCGKAAASAS